MESTYFRPIINDIFKYNLVRNILLMNFNLYCHEFKVFSFLYWNQFTNNSYPGNSAPFYNNCYCWWVYWEFLSFYNVTCDEFYVSVYDRIRRRSRKEIKYSLIEAKQTPEISSYLIPLFIFHLIFMSSFWNLASPQECLFVFLP